MKLIERIEQGLCTEEDAREVSVLMAQAAAMKIFLIEVSLWCSDNVYAARATELLGRLHSPHGVQK